MKIDFDIKREIDLIDELEVKLSNPEFINKANKNVVLKTIQRKNDLKASHTNIALKYLETEDWIKYTVQYMRETIFEQVNPKHNYKPEFFTYVYENEIKHKEILLSILFWADKSNLDYVKSHMTQVPVIKSRLTKIIEFIKNTWKIKNPNQKAKN